MTTKPNPESQPNPDWVTPSGYETRADTFLTVTELAQRLKVRPRTIANLRKAGLPSITMGRRVLWHWPSVEKYMLQKQQGGGK